jgi:chemotaxis protein methyltransferase CheR
MFELQAVPRLDEASFQRVARLASEVAGIHLRPGKETLVQMRLASRLRAVGAASFSEYLDAVEGSPDDELTRFIEALTTHKTSFFREAHHFEFLAAWSKGRTGPVRGWSAGCSSGEEPYTLAMILLDALGPAADFRILGTDISASVLASARAGAYDEEALSAIPARFRSRFVRGRAMGPEIGARVRFARLNLMGAWPMRGPFDFIFCRNVMIYFDRETRHRLCQRFHRLLGPGGHLFLGHSESLMAGAEGFSYVQPAVYRKGAP